MSRFHLPDLGEGLAEASIVEWHVQAGDLVESGQPLVSVETAKAVVDIPSPQAGRVVALLATVGATVPTHAPLVEFEDAPGQQTSVPPAASPIAAPTASATAAPADQGSVVGTLAQEASVRGETFIIGRHRHTEARLQQPRDRRAPIRAPAPPPLFEGGEALDPTRRSMAEALARAHRDVVPVTLTDVAEIGVSERHALTARLVRALVAAARAEPALNAWYDGTRQHRRLHREVHVGIAVDTPHGLFVPVLANAQALSPEAIANEVAALRQAALAHRLGPAQLAGATLTLSNFGAIAGRHATPLVTPPQVAILGAGRAYESPRPSQSGRGAQGRMEIIHQLPLSLSFDHRAVTGGEAARFLQAVMADLALP